MKYCTHCGASLADEAVICPHCGCATEKSLNKASSDSAFTLIAKIFMVIGCVVSASLFLIPLCWTIPMTVHYFKKVNNHEDVGVGFKVCSLLFVSLIAGIMMLCDSENF